MKYMIEQELKGKEGKIYPRKGDEREQGRIQKGERDHRRRKRKE